MQVLSEHLPGGAEGNHKELRMLSVPAEIWTKHLPTMSLEHT
jgi:hypothetical protein